MKLAVPCTTAALALFSSRFLLVKAEAAVWNWVWLILAVGGLIRVILSIKTLSVGAMSCSSQHKQTSQTTSLFTAETRTSLPSHLRTRPSITHDQQKLLTLKCGHDSQCTLPVPSSDRARTM
eukprot:1188273-Prorocentrum_minimum.AAC.2